MKYSYILILVLLIPVFSAAQQVVSVGPNYQNETWYSLANGVVAEAPLAEWDLAFEISGFTASIRTNAARGVELYAVPGLTIQEWALVDTAGISAWSKLHNADTSWHTGALNQGIEVGNDFDLGWGIYNQVTHAIAGDSLFVMALPEGDWKKLRIDQLSGGVYTFTLADLDGNNEITRTLAKAGFQNKNFGYYSVVNDSFADRDPLSADWDLVFHKYVALLAPGVYYGVTGVQSNNGVEVAELTGIIPAEVSLADTGSAEFSSHISEIGYDWKSFNMTSFTWELNDSATYFVKNLSGDIFQLTFTDFGGSGTGDFTFEQSNLTSSIDFVKGAIQQMAVAPNPASDQVNVLLDMREAQPVTLRLLSLNGQVIRRVETGTISGFRQINLDLPELASGLYLLQVSAGDAVATQKILIK